MRFTSRALIHGRGQLLHVHNYYYRTTTTMATTTCECNWQTYTTRSEFTVLAGNTSFIQIYFLSFFLGGGQRKSQLLNVALVSLLDVYGEGSGKAKKNIFWGTPLQTPPLLRAWGSPHLFITQSSRLGEGSFV